MSKPTNFYDAIVELDFIPHVPTRLILAHLVFFYKVDMDVAYLLWVHYRHCDEGAIDDLDEFVSGPPESHPPAPPSKGEEDFYNDCVPEDHKMKCLNCGKFRR